MPYEGRPNRADATGDPCQPELALLVQQNADGVVVVNEYGTVLFANPAAERIFGRSAGQLTGTPIGMPVIADETTEIAVRQPGGRTVDVEMRVVQTWWNGTPALLASLRDVSFRREMEEKLRQSHRMEAIGQLTAGIAHNFNNMLTIVIGNLEVLQCRVRKLVPDPRITQMAETAMQGATRAAKVTQQLLAFARRQHLDIRLVDANQIISDMIELLRGTPEEAIELEVRLAEGLWLTQTDPGQVASSILNLVVNARAAMPSGGKLVVETANVELDEVYAAANAEASPGQYIMIAVIDTGVGMRDDVRARAFEPFFTTKAIGHGTGLGLSQVYGFVKQSGGHIKIRSAPGEGTSVQIYLPRYVEPEADPRRP